MRSESGDYSIGSNVWTGTSKVLEEMGELQQVLGKLIGSHGDTNHYDGSDLRQRIVEEIADLEAAIIFFKERNLWQSEKVAASERTHKKIMLFEQWHKEGK